MYCPHKVHATIFLYASPPPSLLSSFLTPFLFLPFIYGLIKGISLTLLLYKPVCPPLSHIVFKQH